MRVLASRLSLSRILADWKQMVEDLRHPDKEVKIALVGKYTALHDAYISVVEALKHGGIPEHTTVDIKWVDSEELNDDNAAEVFKGYSGNYRSGEALETVVLRA